MTFQSEPRPVWESEFLTTSPRHHWIRVGDWAQQTAEFPNFLKTAHGQDSSSGTPEPEPAASEGKLPRPQCVNDTHSLPQSANQLNKRKTYIMKDRGPDGIAGFWCGATYPAARGQGTSTDNQALSAPGSWDGKGLNL